ncbi:multidrug efflux SMR transporter [Leptolyngbya sp. FACHB-541]|uniref:DMT family transporter n=1 Tax=Leptolyngbya sp. FACHB-541 TaxID=2692810 RepID=UPI00168411C3|nr:multidrug efflux SMR transporter [Leptolyngbya sp. FACHB-541]MBD1997194.1 multidrug efflux SMR transporter [Leptolyngbya sp. FACHB-541]
MQWLYLGLAIVAEVAGTTCMKLSQGFTKTLPSILIFCFYGLCFVFLTMALKKMEITTAYAIWAGLGTALITIVSIVWFREPANALKIISIGLIVLGVIGLRLSSNGH